MQQWLLSRSHRVWEPRRPPVEHICDLLLHVGLLAASIIVIPLPVPVVTEHVVYLHTLGFSQHSAHHTATMTKKCFWKNALDGNVK